jgi:predicted acyl esterase
MNFLSRLTSSVALAISLLSAAGSGQAVAEAMVVEVNVAVPMRDGSILRANVYRPTTDGPHPVIMTLSSYGKDIHFEDYQKGPWEELRAQVPDLCADGVSSCKYMVWETPDPERWVPKGYVIINVDARGAGQSPGYLDPFSPQETRDYYDAIEWAGVQPWSNGKVGLLGISYYAIKQWQVAALQPPHLAAIIPWEGFSDSFREGARQGGIYGNGLWNLVWNGIMKNQYGNPNGWLNRQTGKRSSGGPDLSAAELAGNRFDFRDAFARRNLDDAWYRSRTPDLSQIKVPVLSAGNWGGLGFHERGNIEGFMGVASQEKWLSMHTGTHFSSFYTPMWTAYQMRFFDHYLKGLDNGWEKEPRVQLAIREADNKWTMRNESEWPLARTQWTKVYLNAKDRTLGPGPSKDDARASYQAISNGVDFALAPFEQETEITGPVAAHLWVSSSTSDMDIFATLMAIGPDGKEMTFNGANDPAAPLSQGWLRVSQRKLDAERSTPSRPGHSHDEVRKMTPNQLYSVDVEIWPLSILLKKGSRIVLRLQGKDFERASGSEAVGRGALIVSRGSGPLLHTHPEDRNPAEFAGVNTIATGGETASYIVLPIIPK